MNTKRTTFQPQQMRMIGFFWLTYVLFYLGRVNLAVAIPLIQTDLGLDSAEIALISGAFFWVYALGQLINGYLGDKVSCRRLVFVGLVGSAVLNALFGLAYTLPILLGVWAVNGYMQSTGWGPIVRSTRQWVSPNQQSAAGTILSTSFVVGFILCWTGSAWLLTVTGDNWRALFFIPSILLLIAAACWLLIAKDRPDGDRIAAPETADLAEPQLTEKKQLGIIALIGFLQGMVRDSLSLWAPSMFVALLGLSPSQAASQALVIPVIGFFGVIAAGKLSDHLADNTSRAVAILYATSALCIALALVSLAAGWDLFFAVSLGGVAASIYGVNGLLVTTIPLKLGAQNVSTIAGFIDFVIYMGAGVMGVITGIMLRSWGWTEVMGLWIAICLIGALSSLAAEKLLSSSGEAAKSLSNR